MTQSSSQAAEFYKVVAEKGKVWTVKDHAGFPAPKNFEGQRSMPFWSEREKVEKIIQNVPAYNTFEPYEMELDEFFSKWIPGMVKDGLHVGVNWSGENATGYDVEPSEVKKHIESFLQRE